MLTPLFNGVIKIDIDMVIIPGSEDQGRAAGERDPDCDNKAGAQVTPTTEKAGQGINYKSTICFASYML